MKTIDFTVPGKPTGKERPRVTSHGTYTPTRTRSYEKLVAEKYIEAAKDKYDPEKVEAAEVYITAYFGVPKSWTIHAKRDHYNQPAGKKPDADNIGKIICDALNGVAYKDDACVSELDVSKVYCDKDEEPRVEVTVALFMEVEDDDG